MTVASISKEGKALPWLDYSALVFEFSAAQNGNTIDVSTRGVTKILIAFEADSNGQSLGAAGGTFSGTVYTVGSASARALLVIGR